MQPQDRTQQFSTFTPFTTGGDTPEMLEGQASIERDPVRPEQTAQYEDHNYLTPTNPELIDTIERKTAVMISEISQHIAGNSELSLRSWAKQHPDSIRDWPNSQEVGTNHEAKQPYAAKEPINLKDFKQKSRQAPRRKWLSRKAS